MDEIQKTIEAMKLAALLQPVLNRDAIPSSDFKKYTSDLLLERNGKQLVATLVLTVEPDQGPDDWHWFLVGYLCDPCLEKKEAKLLPPDSGLFKKIASNFFPERQGKVLEHEMSWCFNTPVTEKDREL